LFAVQVIFPPVMTMLSTSEVPDLPQEEESEPIHGPIEDDNRNSPPSITIDFIFPSAADPIHGPPVYCQVACGAEKSYVPLKKRTVPHVPPLPVVSAPLGAVAVNFPFEGLMNVKLLEPKHPMAIIGLPSQENADGVMALVPVIMKVTSLFLKVKVEVALIPNSSIVPRKFEAVKPGPVPVRVRFDEICLPPHEYRVSPLRMT
jgi:hypothetical protein